MAAFDVNKWWAGLSQQDRDLALHWRHANPLPNIVIERLNRHGVMTGSGSGNEPTSRWEWASEVHGFLCAEAGDTDMGGFWAPAT
ncbi:hypothetical protein [Phytohabitans houttuyneae]|uniref:Uncharacterized protein n=1 Tax=Phytohabitans houttuyneae TaxID=1076126 RepID=A0A6V8K6M9_9ACTN|nr:hypothetical protein [Phytohabitans houttuyneae]GFJ79414.1 hypothetical protein Phou_035940 [Phytohabitans houttuyneae]